VVRRRGTVVAVGFYQGDATGLRLGEEFHHNGSRSARARSATCIRALTPRPCARVRSSSPGPTGSCSAASPGTSFRWKRRAQALRRCGGPPKFCRSCSDTARVSAKRSVHREVRTCGG
jgi:hypothetical protein